MSWQRPNIPADPPPPPYLCEGGPGHWAPPGWPSVRLCSESSASLSSPSARPARIPEREIERLKTKKTKNGRWHTEERSVFVPNRDKKTASQRTELQSLTPVDGNQRQESRRKIWASPGGISNDPSTTCYHSKKTQPCSVEPSRSDKRSFLFCFGRKADEGCR